MRRQRLWLCVAPWIFCMIDQGITLQLQSPEYWAGDYSQANEANPWFNWLLRQHPLYFEVGILLWVAVFTLAVVFLPRLLAMIGCVAIVLGHTWGACTWLLWMPFGYWMVLLMFLMGAIAIVLSWEKHARVESPMQRC